MQAAIHESRLLGVVGKPGSKRRQHFKNQTSADDIRLDNSPERTMKYPTVGVAHYGIEVFSQFRMNRKGWAVA